MEQPADGDHASVLIVDDDPFSLNVLDHLVNSLHGCEMVCFDCAEDALGWCAENVPDVVLTDHLMPGLTGLDLITALRAAPETAEVPILMLTSNQDRALRYRALQLGANDFLTKPADPIEVEARMRNMLALRRGQRALADRSASLAEEVAQATRLIVAREHETIVRLSRAAEFRDPETGSHILRIGEFSRILAAGLGLPEEVQDQIRLAAPMHDIGKIGVPDHILLKPGRLDDREFAVMKEHTTIGHRILHGSSSELLKLAAEIAHTHHEWWDGSGYPGGLKADAIPLAGRIVAVVDTFDALTSDRPYQKARPTDAAISLLRAQAGRHFDAACVEAFLRHLDAVLAARARLHDAPLPALDPLSGAGNAAARWARVDLESGTEVLKIAT